MNTQTPTRDAGPPPGEAYPDSAKFFRFITTALLLGALAALWPSSRSPQTPPGKDHP